MKYHQLHIDTDGTLDNYNEISKLLGLKPVAEKESKYGKPHSLWIYEVESGDEDGDSGAIDHLVPVSIDHH